MTNDENGKTEDAFEPEVETQEIWRMPKPVFRTSEGESYKSVKNEDLHETQEPVPAPQAKSSNMPFLLGGAFLMFFIATVFLAGIWFLFLRDIKPPQILTPPVEKATPTPEPTAAQSEMPAPTVAPTETPAPTATPAPDPGGAPANV